MREAGCSHPFLDERIVPLHPVQYRAELEEVPKQPRSGGAAAEGEQDLNHRRRARLVDQDHVEGPVRHRSMHPGACRRRRHDAGGVDDGLLRVVAQLAGRVDERAIPLGEPAVFGFPLTVALQQSPIAREPLGQSTFFTSGDEASGLVARRAVGSEGFGRSVQFGEDGLGACAFLLGPCRRVLRCCETTVRVVDIGLGDRADDPSCLDSLLEQLASACAARSVKAWSSASSWRSRR